MTIGTETLVAAIDDTALKLLQKIGGDSSLTPQDSTIFTEQVKAFDVVVRWAEKRETLVPKAPKDNKFDGIKREFHAVGAKGRSGRGSVPAKGRPDTVIELPGAELDADASDD